MANCIYTKAKEKFLQGQIAWENDFIRCVLVDTDLYTLDQYNHEFLSDIPTEARVATSSRLVNMSATDGVADAGDITIPNVVGNSIEAIVIYKETFNPFTCPLIVYIDNWQHTPHPIIPTGSPVKIQWSDTLNKIFRL